MTWNREPLRVMENGRYLAEGNQPFFWLGDTAWLMLHRLNEEDAVTYLNNRKALGFNVILTVLANSTKGKPVMGNGVKDPARPEYWEFCDRIIKKAEEMGLYLALLPAWGSLVKEGSLTLDNVEAYAEIS